MQAAVQQPQQDVIYVVQAEQSPLHQLSAVDEEEEEEDGHSSGRPASKAGDHTDDDEEDGTAVAAVLASLQQQQPCGDQHQRLLSSQNSGQAIAVVQVSRSGSPSKQQHKLHAVSSSSSSPCQRLLLGQRAAKCIEKHQNKLMQELHRILQQSAATTAAGAAAGAAIGAGAAVAAAEHALCGRVAALRGGLVSPPDSARMQYASAVHMLGSAAAAADAAQQQHSQVLSGTHVCVVELQAQLEAAEAKLHVHRTAAATAKMQMQQLEGLVQQLELKQQQQQEQLTTCQQQSSTQQEQLLLREQTIQQQEKTIEQQRQELSTQREQLAAYEQRVTKLQSQLQGAELGQWRSLSAYASLEEQQLRQAQQQLQEDREEHQLLEQQLDIQQQHVQTLIAQQQEQLRQVRDETQELRMQQEMCVKQQREVQHQREEVLLLMQQAEQQRRELQELQQRLLEEQQAMLERQQLHASSNSADDTDGSCTGLLHVELGQVVPAAEQLLDTQDELPSAVSASTCDASACAVQQQQEPMPSHSMQGGSQQGRQLVPPLPLPKVPDTGLLQQVAQTLASPSCCDSPVACTDSARSRGSVQECEGLGLAVESTDAGSTESEAAECAADDAAAAKTVAVDVGSAGLTWRSPLSSSTSAPQEHGGGCAVQAAADALCVEPAVPSACWLAQQPMQEQEEGDADAQLPGSQPKAEEGKAALTEDADQQQQHETQQQRQRQSDEMQSKQQVPRLWQEVSDSSAQIDHSDWQVIPSPHMLPSADQQHYHASAFDRVLQHLVSANLDTAAAVATAVSPQASLQQQDLMRLAEYLHALAADNTVLSCEVFHLQQLLVQQRQVASSSFEAMAHKLAAESVQHSWEVQEQQLERALQQAASKAAAVAAIDRGQGGGRVGELEGGSGGCDDGTDSSNSSSSAGGDGIEGVDETGAACIYEALKSRVSGMLEAHEARVQDLIALLESEVEACCAEFEAAGGPDQVEQQLSTFEEVYGIMTSESGTAGGNTNTAAQPTALEARRNDAAAVTTDADDDYEAAAAARTGGGSVGCSQQQLQSPRSAATNTKPFVTSPSGHVSLVSSRRTSAAQPPVNARRQSGQQHSMAQRASSAGGSVAAVDVTLQGAAAALLRRKSRLCELSVCSSSDSVTGSGVGVSVDAGSGFASGGLVSRLAQLLGSSRGSSVASSVDADIMGLCGGGADGVVSTTGAAQLSQQQEGLLLLEQQEQEQQDYEQQQALSTATVPGGDRLRRVTLAVLSEAAERLEGETDA